MEVDREKLNSLTTIFGRDIPVHIISEALLKHKNNLDETVNYLLERNPESMIRPPPQQQSQQQQPQQQQPQQQKDQEDLKALQNMFGNDLTQSVIATVLHSNSGDVSHAVDELLTITSKEMQPPQPVPARDMDQTRRMQREIQEMEEFKRLQQRMQEEELRLAEETRRAAEQRVREREQRAADEHMRRAEEKRAAEILQLEQARIAAESSLREQRRQEALAAEIKAQEELAAIRISEQMNVLDEEKKKIELQKKKLVQEEELRKQEDTLRRLYLDAEEKRRRDAIQEEERVIRSRLEEQEIAAKRRLEEEELTRRRVLEEQEFQQRRAAEQERAKYEVEKHRMAAERARLALQEEATLREKERLQQLGLEEEEKRKKEEEQRKQRLEMEHLRMKEEIRRQFMEDEERRQAQEEERKRKLAEDQFDESVVILPASQGAELQCEVKDDVVSVTWNLPASLASPSDWIGIHSVHNSSKYEQYFKTGGIDAGSYDFKGLTPGYHIVHFYPKGTWTPAYSSAHLRIGKEAVVTVKVEGDQIRINYTPSSSSTAARDWIGIYEPSQRNKNYLFTSYGNESGELFATAPRTVGQYEARVFYAGSNYNEQCKTTFNVVDNDRISCTPTTVEQGATLRAEWVMRAKEPSSYNWIGLFRTDEKDNTKYLVPTYISTATVGACDIVVPKDLAVGCYELRLFVNAVGKYVTYKTSNLFNVVAAPPK